jgi:hypothetical protein
VLYTGDWFVGGEFAPHVTLEELRKHGSYVTPFMNPEGIVIYHRASGYLFKKTVEHDEAPKGFNEEAVPRLGSGL